MIKRTCTPYYDEPDNSDEKVEDFTSILIDLVTNFKLRSLKAYKINEKHNLILLLSHPSVQNSLQNIDWMNCWSTECLNILCLCKELRQLEFVQIFLLDTPKEELYKLVAAEKNEIKRFNVNIKCINIKHYN